MKLSNEEIRIFAIKLAKCESEDEVVSLLADYGFWYDESCWRLFGDLENNYSSIGNQQAAADTALVEKIINSIDATIMGDLLSRGIDPKSSEAPQSITEYLKKYKKIPEGKLSKLDKATRSKLSEDILLVSTKNPSSNNPNYCIIDKGEGQTPNSMPYTILSLQASNKLKVGAVQGKFNMGGTGVLMFSGDRKFQIIISRKRQDIAEKFRGNDESFDRWGVTIVRREEPTGNMKSSRFTYLAPGGNILSFEADSLPLKPSYNTAQATPYVESMTDGTFIKIFNYHIRGANSVSTIHLHDRLSLLIPGIALPIKIVECRSTRAKRSKTLYGLLARLEEDKQSTQERVPLGDLKKFRGEELPISTYVFKSGYGESYKNKEGIIYHLNGQCQGFETKTFFNKLNLSYLADSLLVVVDCSYLSAKTCEELFLNSRDRLKKGPIRDEIIKLIESDLRSDADLKRLNNLRRNEALASAIDNTALISNVVGDVLSKSKVLNSLLLQGKDLYVPRHTSEHTPSAQPIEFRKHPRLFNLKRKNRKTAELGRMIRLEYETDVENDYFVRADSPGMYSLECSVGVLADYSLKIINGTGYLSIFIDPNMFSVDDTVLFKLEVSDEYMTIPFTSEFELTIVPKTTDSPSGPSPKPSSGLKKEKELPHIQELRREQWGSDMNENTAIIVKEIDGGYDYFCNMDNKYLDLERRNSKLNPLYLEKLFSTALIVSSMGVISHFQKVSKSDSEISFEIPELVKNVSSSLAPIIIPIILELSKVKEFEKE